MRVSKKILEAIPGTWECKWDCPRCGEKNVSSISKKEWKKLYGSSTMENLRSWTEQQRCSKCKNELGKIY